MAEGLTFQQKKVVMNPAVSVIIPTFNRADSVQKAIDSVLAQTFSDLEIIVVDDGSNDGTGEILKRRYGNRIRYHAQHNLGPSAARNNGIAHSRGEWIAFLDSDDLWENDKLEWQFKALLQFGRQYGACYTDVRLFNNAEKRTLFQMAQDTCQHQTQMGIRRDVQRFLVKAPGAGMLVFIGSILARAHEVRKTGGFDLNLRFGEDTDFLFRLAMITDFCYVNLPLVWFDRAPAEVRHVGPSAEWNRMRFILEQARLRLEKFLRLNTGSTEVRELIREQLRTVHSGLTNCHLEAGEYGQARKAISKAARISLTSNVAVKWLLTWFAPGLAVRTVRHHLKNKNQPFPVI